MIEFIGFLCIVSAIVLTAFYVSVRNKQLKKEIQVQEEIIDLQLTFINSLRNKLEKERDNE